MAQRDKSRILELVLAWREERDLISGMKEKGLSLALLRLISAQPLVLVTVGFPFIFLHLSVISYRGI